MKLSLQDALRRLPSPATGQYPDGQPFATVMAGGSMRVELFATGGRPDLQTPHEQDELYFVQRGQGVLLIHDQRFDAQAGDAFFVAAGTPHHFEDTSTDFATWVVFYGPPGGE